MLSAQTRTCDARSDRLKNECLSVCRPAASVLLIFKNEKFGTFSLYRQRLGKRSSLPMLAMYSICELRASRAGRNSLGVCNVDLLHLLTEGYGHCFRPCIPTLTVAIEGTADQICSR